MIVVWLLGIMDILTAVFIVLGNYHLASLRFFMTFIIYLLVKGIVFRGDLASFIDLAIAVYMILMIFFPITVVSFIAAIYLIQKGILSFFN
jgi:hypothetical protein